MPVDTPLHKAAHLGDVKQIKIIVESGEVEVDELGASDRTALHRAAGANHIEACKCLIEAGANLNLKDRSGRTPLHWAAISGNTEAVCYLVNNGADLFAMNNKKSTSLHNSAEQGKYETVKELLRLCNDCITLCQVANSDDKKAADLAKDANHKMVLKALKEGGDPNAQTSGCCIS